MFCVCNYVHKVLCFPINFIGCGIHPHILITFSVSECHFLLFVVVGGCWVVALQPLCAFSSFRISNPKKFGARDETGSLLRMILSLLFGMQFFFLFDNLLLDFAVAPAVFTHTSPLGGKITLAQQIFGWNNSVLQDFPHFYICSHHQCCLKCLLRGLWRYYCLLGCMHIYFWNPSCVTCIFISVHSLWSYW